MAISALWRIFRADVSTIHGQRGGEFIFVQIHYKPAGCIWIGSVWLAVYERDEVTIRGAEQVWWGHSGALISAVLQLQLICTYSWPLWHTLQLLESVIVHPRVPLLSAPWSSFSYGSFQWVVFDFMVTLLQTLSFMLSQTLLAKPLACHLSSLAVHESAAAVATPGLAVWFKTSD